MSKRHTGGRYTPPKPTPRRSPTPDRAGPPVAAAPVATAGGGGFAELLERAQREVLTVSLCAEHGLPDGATSAVIRIKGQRIGVDGRPGAGDKFAREETVRGLPPGSGPFSLTTRIDNINPGEWQVTGEMVPTRPGRAAGTRRGVADKPVPLQPAAWSWRRWRLSGADGRPIRTGPSAFAPRPGVIPGVWAVMVVLGVIAALVLQATLASRKDLPIGATLTVSLLAVVAGGIGAKAWFVILERRTRRWNGWAIQGFVVALTLVAVLVVPLVDLRLGQYLDITAPAMLLGMAIGRIGCFFAGCCGGRPTCARHGIWSSDRRIGIRRVPTQLLESALALSVAVAAYVVVDNVTPSIEGSVFVGAVALYTLCRQVVLRYRAEGRHSSTGTWFTAGVSFVALVGAAAALWAG